MGPGEDDSAVSGREPGLSTTAQRFGEKLCGTFIFSVLLMTISIGIFVSVSCSTFFCGGCGSGAGKVGQVLASEDSISPLASPTSLDNSLGSCFWDA